MKTRIFSIILSLSLLLFFTGATLAQNKPEKKETKTEKQMVQTKDQKEMKTNQNQTVHTTNKTQKDVKTTENNTTTNKDTKQATVTKDNKDNESVNTQYHKKEATTTNGNQNK